MGTTSFREAADLLCLTGPALAELFGLQPQTIRQMRLNPDNPNYRRAPDGWEKVLAKLARERGGELAQLAKQLEK
jgi:hypothetical protein